MTEHGCRMRDVQRMPGGSRAVVTRLIEAKFVKPDMHGREQRFVFRHECRRSATLYSGSDSMLQMAVFLLDNPGYDN